MEPDDPTDHAAALHAEALEALAALDLERAPRLAEDAHASFLRASGPDHPDVASAALLRSRIAREASDYAAALRWVEDASRTLARARAEYGDEPVILEMIADTAAHHAAVLLSLGRYADGERLARVTLEDLEPRLGGDTDPVAMLCNAHGMCCKYLTRFEDAAASYARALAIIEAIHGADTVELASLEHNLGGLHHARGEPAIAEPHARRAVELRTAALGPDHPTVAADVAAWASILEELGRIGDATVAYDRALAIFRTTYGETHYEVGFTLGALGAMLAGESRWHEARTHLDRALEIQTALLGELHPDVALLHHYLAFTALGAGDPVRARRHIDQAVTAFERSFDREHPRLRDAMELARRISATSASV